MNTTSRAPRLGFGRSVFALLMMGSVYAVYVRRVYGLGTESGLSDIFPWGFCAGLGVFCGLGLAAGGFMVAAVIYALNLAGGKAIARVSVLIAFLGYLVAVLALMFNLGRPERLWPLMTTWNPRSVLFGMAWALMLYTAVLAVEFAPEMFQSLGWGAPPSWMRAVRTVLVLLSAVLATLHQSYLTNLFLMAPQRFSPLWSGPLLPILFALSAVCASLAMVIFASWHTDLAFGRGLPARLLSGVVRPLAVLLCFYLGLRFLDFANRGLLLALFGNDADSYLLGLEIYLLLLPALLLIHRHDSASPRMLYFCAATVIAGFLTNRLNTCITTVESVTGAMYLPKWTEVILAYGVIAVGGAMFSMAAKRWPLYLES